MGRLTGLDAQRGIAAICVVFYHLSAFFDFPAIPKGYLAVDFFFALSGYVMARAFDARLTAGLPAHSFVWKRYKRFVPMMAIGLVLGILYLLVLKKGLPDGKELIFGLMLVPLLNSAWAFPLNNPTWSISLELIANAVHGLRLPARVIFVSASIANIAILALHDVGSGPTGLNFLWGIPRVLSAYFLGVLLYRSWRDEPPFRVPFILFGAFGFLLLELGPWTDLLFTYGICPLIIAAGLQHAPRWGGVIGHTTFPLYATHYPILGIVSAMGGNWQLGLTLTMACAGTIASTLHYGRIKRTARQFRMSTLQGER